VTEGWGTVWRRGGPFLSYDAVAQDRKDGPLLSYDGPRVEAPSSPMMLSRRIGRTVAHYPARWAPCVGAVSLSLSLSLSPYPALEAASGGRSGPGDRGGWGLQSMEAGRPSNPARRTPFA
jgi:hypothetical protein